MNDDHCWHDKDDLTQQCCFCPATRRKTFVSEPSHPLTFMHGNRLPYRERHNGWTVVLRVCEPHSYRALSGTPCTNCHRDSGEVFYASEDCMGRPGVLSYECGCRKPPHPWRDNGSLDKCRVCQLPQAHDIHSNRWRPPGESSFAEDRVGTFNEYLKGI